MPCPSDTVELALDALTPGAILARSVIDARGAVLLSEGATLTESNLNSLARRGITHVTVHRMADTLPPEEAAARCEAAWRRVEAVLQCAGDGPAAVQLRRIALALHGGAE
jgi:hypothetical protein